MKLSSHTLLHNNNSPMVFVGSTYYNKALSDYFNATLVTVEEIENNSQDWFDQHQFIAISSNPQTKYFIVNQLANKNPHYFSIVGTNNQFHNLSIGHGTFIESYNTAQWDNCSIGDHCTIGSYIQIGHNTTIDNFCQVGAYSFINFANLKDGNCVGVRSTILGSGDHNISIAMHCNIMMNSTITKDLVTPGKYFGNKRISDETSLVYDML